MNYGYTLYDCLSGCETPFTQSNATVSIVHYEALARPFHCKDTKEEYSIITQVKGTSAICTYVKLATNHTIYEEICPWLDHLHACTLPVPPGLHSSAPIYKFLACINIQTSLSITRLVIHLIPSSTSGLPTQQVPGGCTTTMDVKD